MRFQVPQFIEVEDKIFGPLTGTQFVYVAGGVGFAIAMWLILPKILAVIVGAPVAGLGLALAFMKVNDRPFILTLEAAFNYLTRTKLYIWEKKKPKIVSHEEIALDSVTRKEDPSKLVPAATGSKIKDLAWSLDVHENQNIGSSPGRRVP
ncbi:MAG: PrgI family protein [Patescibacteria group bacterium]